MTLSSGWPRIDAHAVAPTPAVNPPRDAVILADNLPFMGTMADASVDLIYADPPFNSNRTRGRTAKSGAAFRDHYADARAYLDFLGPRLREMHRLLSSRGSIYVHLDWRVSHHARVLMDEIFGADHFLNEIIWSYRSGSRPGRWFTRKHDTILLYARSIGRHTFHRLREGTYRTLDMKHAADGRPFKSTRRGPILFHPQGPAMADVWDIPILSTVSKERTRYPTQKPERLLERIILSSSNPNDLVADFFCGSGTTLAVARRLERSFLGCDINPQATAITCRRLGLSANPP